MIMYIGFSTKTHKFIANIICRHFKHCAPILVNENRCEIYQFTKHNQINIIKIRLRDMKILEKYGWKFVEYDIEKKTEISDIHAITCVQFTKKFCGLRALYTQTPDALFKYITTKI